jgi:hypothetical protein
VDIAFIVSIMSIVIGYLSTISRELGAIVNSFDEMLNFTKAGRLLFFV